MKRRVLPCGDWANRSGLLNEGHTLHLQEVLITQNLEGVERLQGLGIQEWFDSCNRVLLESLKDP